MLLILSAVPPGKAISGLYLNGAHGSISAGVNRSSISLLGYVRANCTHCHEQHASIGGTEPAPAGGWPSPYILFYNNYVNQTDNICVQCHVDVSAVQTGGGIFNRSYSFRAGGWTVDTLNDIKEAFSFAAPASSHDLDDIKTFINGKWGYTADSNPCTSCHNPHAAQGDPLASPNSAKSSDIRGWPVSRPSEHSTVPWDLWGDDYIGPGTGNGERMNNYTANYQAPFRFGSTTTYEPDGSTTQDGSNLADFSTFCSDCHNASNIIYSTNLGRNLRTINWDIEKHGRGNADTSLCGDNPYPSGGSGLGKVLSCLDCHEPHGSPNAFLIRQEVNGGTLTGAIGSFSTTAWNFLCDRCHQDDKEIDANCQEDHYYIIHHSNTGCNSDRPYSPVSCGSCHGGGGGGGCTSSNAKKICTDCHFHGSSVSGNPTF
jgi:hypothetical protein